MTTVQKLIKYAALVLAVFLVVNIIAGILGVFSGLLWLVDGSDIAGENKTYELSQNVQSLHIDITAGDLKIISGDNFSLESNHKHLQVSSDNGVLKITETKRYLNGTFNDVHLILTIPKNVALSSADISTGAGIVEIQWLDAGRISLEQGAGEIVISFLRAQENIVIQGGAGRLTISEGMLKNLDLDMGVGEMNLRCRLSGDCQLDLGVGQTNLELIGSPEDYTITFQKGLGDAKLDGDTMNADRTYGTGNNRIYIEGGVGSIDVHFAK